MLSVMLLCVNVKTLVHEETRLCFVDPTKTSMKIYFFLFGTQLNWLKFHKCNVVATHLLKVWNNNLLQHLLVYTVRECYKES